MDFNIEPSCNARRSAVFPAVPEIRWSSERPRDLPELVLPAGMSRSAESFEVGTPVTSTRRCSDEDWGGSRRSSVESARDLFGQSSPVLKSCSPPPVQKSFSVQKEDDLIRRVERILFGPGSQAQAQWCPLGGYNCRKAGDVPLFEHLLGFHDVRVVSLDAHLGFSTQLCFKRDGRTEYKTVIVLRHEDLKLICIFKRIAHRETASSEPRFTASVHHSSEEEALRKGQGLKVVIRALNMETKDQVSWSGSVRPFSELMETAEPNGRLDGRELCVCPSFDHEVFQTDETKKRILLTFVTTLVFE